MARVRLGVKRMNRGGFEGDDLMDPESLEAMIQWIEINGHRFDANEIGLSTVDHHAGGQFHEVTIKLSSRGYSTVDYRTTESEPCFETAPSSTGDHLGLVDDD